VAGRRAGLAQNEPQRTLVTAAFDTARRPGRCEFRPARIVGRDGLGRSRVTLLSPSYSARVALLAAADGLAILPAEAEHIAEGDPLDFIPLS
jgi:molybdopterin molybdotransferase